MVPTTVLAVVAGCGASAPATGVAEKSASAAERLGGEAAPARLAIAPNGARSVVALADPGASARRRVLLWRARPRSRFGLPAVLARATAIRRPFGLGLA